MRRLVGSLLLALGAMLLALGAAELVVRGLRIGALPEAEPAQGRPESLRGLPDLRGVAALARPNARGVFSGVLHRTNDRGLRGPEYTPTPGPGVFRIAVVGDSYTMGQGVWEEESYPAVLQSRLNARGDGRRYEVLNLGLAGTAIRHNVQRLERVGLPYDPHLVVYGFTPNDIMGDDYRPPRPEDQQAARALVSRFEDSPSLLLRLVWPRLVFAKSAWRPIPGTYEYVLEENYFRNPAAWRQVEDGLARLAELARSRGVCAHVFVHTRMNQLFFHPFERIYARVAQEARDQGLSASISLPFFRGRDVSALRLSLVDSHPNAEGQRLHAEALLSALEELPAHCWSPGHYEPR